MAYASPVFALFEGFGEIPFYSSFDHFYRSRYGIEFSRYRQGIDYGDKWGRPGSPGGEDYGLVSLHYPPSSWEYGMVLEPYLYEDVDIEGAKRRALKAEVYKDFWYQKFLLASQSGQGRFEPAGTHPETGRMLIRENIPDPSRLTGQPKTWTWEIWPGMTLIDLKNQGPGREKSTMSKLKKPIAIAAGALMTAAVGGALLAPAAAGSVPAAAVGAIPPAAAGSVPAAAVGAIATAAGGSAPVAATGGLLASIGSGAKVVLGGITWVGGKLLSAPKKVLDTLTATGTDPKLATALEVLQAARAIQAIPAGTQPFVETVEYIPGAEYVPSMEAAAVPGLTFEQAGKYLPWMIGALFVAAAVSSPRTPTRRR